MHRRIHFLRSSTLPPAYGLGWMIRWHELTQQVETLFLHQVDEHFVYVLW